MLQINLNLKPEIEKQFIDIINKDFSGSYEKFVEKAIKKHQNVVSKLIDI